MLDSVAGIVLGDFTDCDEIDDNNRPSPTTRQVLEERLGRLTIPVVLDGAFGHGERKLSLPYGVEVELAAEDGTLRAIEGAVT